MSFNTSRSSCTIFSGRESLTLSSPFSKSKDVSDIFLDKKTITRKLQKLMLDVRDLETKMFFSKLISYLDNQDLENNKLEELHIKMNEKFDQQRIEDLLFSNQTKNEQKLTEEVTIFAGNESKNHEKVQNFSLCPLLVSLDLHPTENEEKSEEKDMFETATSEGFFPRKRPSIHISNPIIEESFSEASTIQCECGLFQALLLMVSRFIKEEIVKNRQQSEDDCLEIDEEFVEEITKEVIQKFYSRDTEHKKEVEKLRLELEKTKETLKSKEQLLAKDGMIAKESLAIKEALKLKEAQHLQAVEQLGKMGAQLKNLDRDYNECSKKLAHEKMNFEQLEISFSELQDHYLTVNKQKQEVESKLQIAQRQIEKHADDKELYEETKQHEIDSLSFELELKNTEIRNMKTIIESLQKRTSIYSQEIDAEGLKKQNNEQNLINEDITAEKSEHQEDLEQFVDNKLSNLQLENELLREELMLVYDKLNKIQLF